MARREDEDDITASDKGDGRPTDPSSTEDASSSEDASPSGEDSPEDEFRDWVGETESKSESRQTAGGTEKSGWLGRVFGKSKPELADTPEELFEHVAVATEDPIPQLEGVSDPEALGVLPAIQSGEEHAEPVAEPAPEPAETPQPEVVEELAPKPTDEPAVDPEPWLAEIDDGDEPGTTPTGAQGAADQASFTELWGDPSEIDADADIADFDSFTSEDYLQATTREYAGLAEAVARAEEEHTAPIAVSAGIPGLESGLVGLEDVVSAEGGPETTDVIEPPTPSDLPMRVLTAVGLVALFAASLLSPYGIGALVFVVLGISAGELFAALIRGGYRPLSIFGFVGIAGALLGTWVSGPVAVPIAILLTVIAVFLFYATVPGRRSALENATLTILVTAWIGGLGAFVFDFLKSDDYVWLVLALVVTVAAMDVGQYFIGRRIGRRPLAPVVSPKKTIEGYIAGVIVAIAVGAAFAWAEPFEIADGLLIGAVVALISPLGDLAVSVLKRALGVKDMGYILPGHGGVLDRIDAMVLTIPALWIAYSWMGLLN